MPPEERLQQPASETSTFLFGDVYTSPQLLPVCCICGVVRDDISAGSSTSMPWMTLKQYRSTHGQPPTPLLFTHTYCPDCLLQVQDTVRIYFAEQGALP